MPCCLSEGLLARVEKFVERQKPVLNATPSPPAGIACWLQRRTRDRKVASSNPGRSGGRIFFSGVDSVLTFIQCPFHPRVNTVAHKRPRSFSQKCRWLVIPKYAYTLDPTKSEWTAYAAVQAGVWELMRKQAHTWKRARTQLVREYSATIVSASITELLWTDSGLKSGISVRDIISTLKKRKKKESEA